MLLWVHMLKKLGLVVLVLFAAVGVLFCIIFLALHFGWLNVRGASAERNKFFTDAAKAVTPQQVQAFTNLGAQPTGDPAVTCLEPATEKLTPACDWNKSPEWAVVRAGIAKDKKTIERVAIETGVSSRQIAAVVIPEQLRYFTSDRENFKKLFEPLKALGSMSKFSLGVSGIKEDTAKSIELSLQDSTSPFYPGSELGYLISYPADVNHDELLYTRLSDVREHYYAYLYAALYVREIEAQWAHQGYTLQDKPGIITTLFNIGFGSSKPKTDPKLGGSTIVLNDHTYGFGELGKVFYDSAELTAVFPPQ